MNFKVCLTAAVFLWACNASERQTPARYPLSDEQGIVFLDSAAASKAMVTDTVEHFFEQINVLDMGIQLKMSRVDGLDRTALLEVYKNSLRKDVLDFTKEEIHFIKNVFRDIFADCNSISKNIFPPAINLIKIRGSHYGAGAFYTRQNCIIIPQAELENPDLPAFKRVMLHELFHIFSRFNPTKKLDLYRLIGFKSIGGNSPLELDSILKSKMILNPDGIDCGYSIQLREKDSSAFDAVPLIVANEAGFREKKPKFFDYLDFGLYKIRPGKNEVVADSSGNSTIQYRLHPEFFEQITDNSNYIIHPDELMADNFAVAVLGQKDSSALKYLSEPGKELIRRVIETLRQ